VIGSPQQPLFFNASPVKRFHENPFLQDAAPISAPKSTPKKALRFDQNDTNSSDHYDSKRSDDVVAALKASTAISKRAAEKVEVTSDLGSSGGTVASTAKRKREDTVDELAVEGSQTKPVVDKSPDKEAEPTKKKRRSKGDFVPVNNSRITDFFKAQQ